MSRQVMRNGVKITKAMLRCMVELERLEDGVWVTLETYQQTTIDLLFQRDYVDISWRTGVATYKLSARGRMVLPIFLKPARQRGGVCRTCGERERYISPTGRPYAECKECLRVKSRELYKRRGRRMGKCKCGKPRAISATGKVASHCVECRSKLARKYQRAATERKLARARAGDVPRCKLCGEKVHVSVRTVYRYCQKHLHEWSQREYRAKVYARVMGGRG